MSAKYVIKNLQRKVNSPSTCSSILEKDLMSVRYVGEDLHRKVIFPSICLSMHRMKSQKFMSVKYATRILHTRVNSPVTCSSILEKKNMNVKCVGRNLQRKVSYLDTCVGRKATGLNCVGKNFAWKSNISSCLNLHRKVIFEHVLEFTQESYLLECC